MIARTDDIRYERRQNNKVRNKGLELPLLAPQLKPIDVYMA